MDDSVEVWKTVEGYEGLYEVSNLGRFARLKNGERFIRRINYATSYPSVSFLKRNCDKTQKSMTLHAVVAKAFIGARPDGCIIRHLDGDRYNAKASNLVYGTVEQNVEDSIKHRIYKGRRNGRSLLCEKGAEAVRMLLEQGNTLSSIAQRLNVSIGTIHAIKTGRNWSKE
jgi:DNA-binding NarL/FixJ family response regulator